MNSSFRYVEYEINEQRCPLSTWKVGPEPEDGSQDWE